MNGSNLNSLYWRSCPNDEEAYRPTVLKKSYLPLWSEELFEVAEIQYTNPITYKLKDPNGEAITSSFYEQEISHRFM
jgi:hypothetical protein